MPKLETRNPKQPRNPKTETACPSRFEFRVSNLFRNSSFGFPISRQRRAFLHWPLFAFLIAFTILLCILMIHFLMPAAQAAQNASPADKLKLRAVSALLLSVVLFVLFTGLLLSVRLSRRLSSRPKPTKTQYIDAWSESAKRLKTPPPDDLE